MAQFVHVAVALSDVPAQFLAVTMDFSVVPPYFGTFLCNTAPVAPLLSGAQLALILLQRAVVVRQFVAVARDFAIVAANFRDVAADFATVAVDFTVVVKDLGAVVAIVSCERSILRKDDWCRQRACRTHCQSE